MVVATYVLMLLVCVAGLFVGIGLMFIVPWRHTHKFMKKEKELKGQFSEYYREVLEVEIGNEKKVKKSKSRKNKKKKNKDKKKLRKMEDFLDPTLQQIRVNKEKRAPTKPKKKTKVQVEKETKDKKRRVVLERAWDNPQKIRD